MGKNEFQINTQKNKIDNCKSKMYICKYSDFPTTKISITCSDIDINGK